MDQPAIERPTIRFCTHHPEREAERACGKCARDFCEDCLVEIVGRVLCGPCKRTAVRAVLQPELIRNAEANDALMLSLVGIPCFGLILQPLALLKAARALRRYREEPELPDRWKAITAISIAVIYLIAALAYFGLLAVFSMTGGLNGMMSGQ